MSRAMLDVMNLPPSIVEIMVTSDGHYLGREAGDCGFNAFLGKPNPQPAGPGPRRSWRIFRALAPGERRALVRRARACGVDLRIFLTRMHA